MSDVNIQTFSGKVNVSNNFTVGSGHLFVDTQNNKVGLNTNTPEANLHVTGNTYISTDISVGGTLTMGTVTVEALHSLDAVTSVGNTTPHTVEFQNTDTSLVASGNVEVAKDLMVSEDLTVSGNVEVGGDMNLLHMANTASIKLNSNVVAEFPRSKKLIKYPRVALTSAASTTSGYQGYKVTSSFHHSGFNDWEAFDNGGDTVGWHTANGALREYNNGGEGTYSGTLQTRLASNTELGEWLQIELPEAIRLERYVIIPQGTLGGNAGNSPGSAVVYGSNDGTTWKELHRYTDQIVDSGGCKRHTFQTSTIETYNRFAIVVTKRGTTGGAGFGVSIQEWELYGVPEYDPDADGVDVVVKSEANVPNTEWLELYYDAKNYSGSGDVQDETANNRDAEMNATFNNGEIKSFDFTGAYTSNVTTSDHGLGTGDVAYTVSYWFKRIQQRNSYDYLYIAGNGGTTGQASLMWINSNRLYLDHWGTATRYEEPIQNNRWYHVAAGHRGGPAVTNDFLFIDGQNVGVPISAPQTFSLQGTKLTLGTSHNTTNEFLEGSIANFRLFNRALSQDEIYQLYAYQKEYFGHGNLNMTLKAGRLGIGTSEPRAALDVRGVIHGTSPATFIGKGTTATNVTASATVLPVGNVIMDTAGSWDATTSRYYVKVPGIYFVSTSRVTIEVTGVYVAIYIYVNGSTSTQVTFQGGSGSYPSGSLSTIVSVKEGDYIEIRASTDINSRAVGGYYDVRMIHMSM